MANEKEQRRPTRVPEGPVELFNGEICNGAMLRSKYLNNMPEAALRRMVSLGLPKVTLPGSQRNWFRPSKCLEWFVKHEKQLNQPRTGRRG
jgi:hypothetical protein